MPGMIVAPQPIAVEEGAKVLAAGGNAFDAALTTAAVQGVIDPHSCGLGGYLVMCCHPAGSTAPHAIVDAPAVAGARVTPEMWQDIVLGMNPRGWGYFLKGKVNDDGYQSVCTPGMVRGMKVIHERWGTRSWSDMLAPAIRVANEGFVVNEHLASRWKEPRQYPDASSNFDKLHATPDAKRIWLKPDGSSYEAGETIQNRDYGRSLERLVKQGADDFYTGELAAEMVADLKKHDGWVTADDLANYQHREEPPVVISYRDYTIVTNQPPHGGPTLAAILNILEGYDLSSYDHNSAKYIELVSMAMKAAFADRNRHLADPSFENVPLEWLVSKDRASHWRDVIDKGEPIVPGPLHQDTPDTTQVTVVDRWGNCVSLTHSLGMSSGAITPGLGYMYNNSMVNFHPYPGHPNSIAPRKGRTTGMTPTIVLKGNKPVLVIGAPGATRIITSILQVIVNVLDFNMSVTDAVISPRFDCQGEMIFAHMRIPQMILNEVAKKHAVTRLPQSYGGMALVHAITIDEHSGALKGAADAGADGMAMLVP
ncbi:MAG: gamma-glutamyltransferase [Planctomycetota bacterium]|nr:gamma-glutamyltransferase [Planctomycetota bacterium]MDA1211691.1 gamma-glutamyltransferase [Planctomycetota bacterium]